jgi:Fic family protein
MYIYENLDWPHFLWDKSKINEILPEVRYKQGKLLGSLGSMAEPFQAEASLRTLTQDVLKTSEIEGEILDKQQVRSSLARHLGLDIGGLIPADRNVDGIVEMMLDATRHYNKPLTQDRLFAWHASLFPTAYSGMVKIKVGGWCDDHAGPMQVVSGPYGHERVHFQAPAAPLLPQLMSAFLDWYNRPSAEDLIIKAAIAHLWFVTLHPFDDGNGRIARAIADMTLAKSDNTSQRFYSMSAQIRTERKTYYDQLENTQKGSLDITNWLVWFCECLSRAIDHSDDTISKVIAKARFWDRFSGISFNERQIKVMNLLLGDFEGKLTSSKWAKLCKCSQDTAHRDILDLIEKCVLKRAPEGGRSTSYILNV